MNALSPEVPGQTVGPMGLVVWNVVEGTSQRVECPRGFWMLLALTSSGVTVPLRGNAIGCGMRKQMSHGARRWKRPSLPPLLPLKRKTSFLNGSGFESIL